MTDEETGGDVDARRASTDMTQYVAESIAPEVGRFVGTIAGSPSFEIGELVAGHFRYRRFKQGIKQMQKAQALIEEAGLEAHQIPMRTLVPLIEGGSTEDDDEMGDRWAALLANAAGGDLDVPPSFPSIMRELEPRQAQILEAVFAIGMVLAPELRRDHGIARRAIGPLDQDFPYHVENLERLGLVSPGVDENKDPYGVISLTAFGAAFVRACQKPGTVYPPPRFTTKEQVLEVVAENRARWSREDGIEPDPTVDATSSPPE
jgi:hypothetical protein